MDLNSLEPSPVSSFISVRSWMNFVSGSEFPPNQSSSVRPSLMAELGPRTEAVVVVDEFVRRDQARLDEIG